jgi:hypothetical protein
MVPSAANAVSRRKLTDVTIRAFAWRYDMLTDFECGSISEALVQLELLVDDGECAPDRIEADGDVVVDTEALSAWLDAHPDAYASRPQ